jgi:hypothetical protein
MANQTKPVVTQSQASNQPAASSSRPAGPGAPPASQNAKPEPKLPGIRVLKEGSDQSTQNVRTLTETKREK